MKCILAAVLIFLLNAISIIAAKNTPSILEVNPKISVAPLEKRSKSKFPSVSLASNRSCVTWDWNGGAVIDWKIEDCQTVNINGTKCLQRADRKQKRYEFEFISQNNSTTLGIEFKLTINGQELRVYREKLPGTVESLKTYIVRGSFGFPEILRGKIATVGLLVYRVNKIASSDSYNVEACAETDFLLA